MLTIGGFFSFGLRTWPIFLLWNTGLIFTPILALRFGICLLPELVNCLSLNDSAGNHNGGSVVTCIFNVVSPHCFPKVWKMAEATPVLKSGNPENPCNHRPISLPPVLSKVSERLAHFHFVDYVTTHKKLSKNKSGNRKRHSTETALLHVTGDFLMAID